METCLLFDNVDGHSLVRLPVYKTFYLPVRPVFILTIPMTQNYANNGVMLWNNYNRFQLKTRVANSIFLSRLLWEIFNRNQMHMFSQPELEGPTHMISAAMVVCNTLEKQQLFNAVKHQDIIIKNFLLLLYF